MLFVNKVSNHGKASGTQTFALSSFFYSLSEGKPVCRGCAKVSCVIGPSQRGAAARGPGPSRRSRPSCSLGSPPTSWQRPRSHPIRSNTKRNAAVQFDPIGSDLMRHNPNPSDPIQTSFKEGRRSGWVGPPGRSL